MSRSWYMAADGKSEGPFPEERFRQLIAEGRVAPATLVWADGMSEWQRADQVPGLLAMAPPAVRMPPSAPPGVPMSALAGEGNRLSGEFPVWGLFWRSIVAALGTALVVPAPWAITWYYRWLIEHIRAPGRPDLSFAGKAGDIWYIIAFQAVVILFNVMPLRLDAGVHIAISLPVFMAAILVQWIIIRWIVRNITSGGQPLPLTFAGGFWGLLGWALLGYLSVVTIIGWAWVDTAAGRWVCRNIQGSRRPISFEASGWGLLWRSLVFAITAIFIIPIPWMLRWYLRWAVAQVALGSRAA